MADAIAALNLRHLAMAAELRALFDAAGAAVAGILGGTDDARGARARLLGRGGVPGGLLALARLAEAIQRIERTALSFDGRSRTAAGDAGAGSMRQGAAALDMTALTTEQDGTPLGYSAAAETRTLTTHLYALRQKIEADLTKPTMLLTVYRIVPDPAARP